MRRKNKNPNIIDKAEAIEILSAYGYRAIHFNYYQIRIRPEESQDIFDWYHTTGSLVVTRQGFPHKIGVYKDIEEVAEIIKNEVYK